MGAQWDVNRPTPPMVTMKLDAGKKNKLRAGDILGALTQGAGVDKEKIGKISIYPFHSYVAVDKATIKKSWGKIRSTPIKGRVIKTRLISV